MNIYYINNKNEKINLSEWPIMIQSPETLFKHQWSYVSKSGQKNGGKITRFYKGVTEKSVTLSIFTDSKKEYNEVSEQLTKITENDIINNTPGKLYVNDYYLQCYIYATEYEDYEENLYAVDQKVSILSAWPFWMKPTEYSFRANSVFAIMKDLDYEYDYEHDYASEMQGQQAITNETLIDSNFEMIIYGGCINPSINISGHIYKVYTILEKEEHLVINSMTKEIYKIKIYGERINLFDSRERNYDIFAKIKAGTNEIRWNGTYDFQLTLYDERSEPAWI